MILLVRLIVTGRSRYFIVVSLNDVAANNGFIFMRLLQNCRNPMIMYSSAAEPCIATVRSMVGLYDCTRSHTYPENNQLYSDSTNADNLLYIEAH